MRTSGLIVLLLAMAGFAGCQGDPSFTGGAGGGGTNIATVSVVTSAPTLPSGAGQSVTITATVSDAANQPLQGVEVTLSADSGTLGNAGPLTTDVNGDVSTTLAAGSDASNRTITVTATAGAVQGNVTVDVVGTTLSIAGPGGLPNGGTGNYTATLLDSTMTGIQGETVDLTSDTGNTLSASSLVTDAAGEVQFQVTGAVTGMDTLTASSLGLTATQSLNVVDDTFVLTAPVAGAQIQLNVDEPVELTWMVNGAPQVGQTISFSTTFGTLSAPTAATDANGVATVTISSANPGAALISAVNAAGTTAQVQVEFVAPVATTNPGVAKSSTTLSAPGGGSGGSLSGAGGSTMSLSTTGVVRADADRYSIEFSVRLTDASGAAIAGAAVSNELVTNGYLQGAWHWNATASSWVQSVSAGPCAVDVASEPVATSGSAGIVTDADGRGSVTVSYPADYARWLDVTLIATAVVDGNKVGASSAFLLPIDHAATRTQEVSPPGAYSPYGTGNSCGSML